jgi:hypothetical protein
MKMISSIHNYLNSVSRKNSKIDGRFFIIAILLGYFSLLFISSFFTDYYLFWKKLGVPSLNPTFFDLRTVIVALKCARLGENAVAIDSTCKPDPIVSMIGYPRPWVIFSPLGLDEQYTFVIGVLLGLLFYLFTLKIIGRLNFYEALIYSLIFCSPPVMLLIERGNVDIIVYLFLSLSLIILSEANKLIERSVAYLLIVLSGFLKLFPIFGLAIIFKERRKVFWFLIVSLATPFLVYYLTNLEQLKAIAKFQVTPFRFYYGYESLLIYFSEFLSSPYLFSSKRNIVQLIIFIFIGLFLAFILSKILINIFQELKFWLTHDFNSEQILQPETQYLDGYRLGCSLFIGTFVLGTTYAYKLTFLLFAIPQMLAWIKSKNKLSLPSSLAILGFLASLYLLRNPATFIVSQIIFWFLLIYFVYGFSLSLPKWVKLTIHSAFSRTQ